MTIIGILARESIVLKETSVTESSVSAPYFEENIVVIAAVGAQLQMVSAKRIVPLIPHRYIANRTTSGKINNLKRIAKRHFISLSPFRRLLFAKW